jgi:hypothetical protein
LSDLEDSLRAAMHAAVEGEQIPAHLVMLVVRRQRRRRLFAAGLAGLVAVVIGAVLGLNLVAGVQRTPPQARSVPGWALPWPDHRNGSVPQSVLDSAVHAWRFPSQWASQRDEQVQKAPSVIWYVGQTVADGQVVVVTFEADHRLISGWASASLVMNNSKKSLSECPECVHPDPWTLTSAPAPRPGTPGLAIGLNVHAVSLAYTSSAPPNPDNWIVILTEPSVRRVIWSTSTEAGTVTGVTNSPFGLAVADAGHITAPVQLTGLIARAGNALAHDEFVAVPGDAMGIPQLARPATILPIPHNHFVTLLGSGQGNRLDQAPWLFAHELPQNSPRAGRTADGTPEVSWHLPAGGPGFGPGAYALVGSCYGPEALQLSALGHTVGTMRCNSERQVVNVSYLQLRALGASGEWFSVSTSALTRWQLFLMVLSRQ